MVEITYEVKGKTAVITLNVPEVYNALTGSAYRRLEQLVRHAADEPDTLVTLIQSTGKFFSAGANLGSGAGQVKEDVIDLKQLDDPNDPKEYEFLKTRTQHAYTFGTRNLVATETFYNHPRSSSLPSMALLSVSPLLWLLSPTLFTPETPLGSSLLSLTLVWLPKVAPLSLWSTDWDTARLLSYFSVPLNSMPTSFIDWASSTRFTALRNTTLQSSTPPSRS